MEVIDGNALGALKEKAEQTQTGGVGEVEGRRRVVVVVVVVTGIEALGGRVVRGGVGGGGGVGVGIVIVVVIGAFGLHGGRRIGSGIDGGMRD